METNKTKIEDDIKENKLINSTLRYMLFLTLCLFLSSLYYNGEQQRLNRTLRTKSDKIIMQGYKILEGEKNFIALDKFHKMTIKNQNIEIKKNKIKRLKNKAKQSHERNKTNCIKKALKKH